MLINLLVEIRDLLKEQCTNASNDLPNLIYAKDIEQNYRVNLNKATEFCKRYGINFGGWCIESTKFKEIMHDKKGNLFE